LEARNTNERTFVVLERSLKGSSTDAQASSLLSPVLVEALTELAAAEDLPVATLIALLLNEALGQRLHRSRS
jgi:hypothetical protein